MVREKVLLKLAKLFTAKSDQSPDTEPPVTFKRPIVVYDTDASSPLAIRLQKPNPNSSLLFESRFECGNLQQARRMYVPSFCQNFLVFCSGTYEYDLVMTPDLVTQRHTQWYFFKVMGAQSRVEYTFRILNFLKPMSLYKQGMKVLFYSSKLAKKTGYGWVRVGTDIR